MSQTAYNAAMDVAVKGMPADSGPQDIVTYNNPTDQIVFGRAVEKVSGDADGIKLPDNGSAVLKGVAVRSMTEEHEYFAAKSAVPVMKKGRICVEVEEAVTPDDSVYVAYAGRKQKQTLTFDADLITGNTVDLKVDGVSIASVPFNATHAQTMTDLAAAIAALTASVSAATASGRVVTMTGASNGVDFVVSDVAVTGGATQATGTVAETVASIPDSDKGKFRKGADSPTRALAFTSAKFMTAAAAGGLAIVDLNVT